MVGLMMNNRFRFLKFLFTVTFFINSYISALASSSKSGHVLVLYTGGTIGGLTNPDNPSTYTAGAIQSGEAILQEIEFFKDKIKNKSVIVQDVFETPIDSRDFDNEHWQILANAIQTALDTPRVEGIIIMHGTDTLELTLTLFRGMFNLRFPIVYTGAMRPADSKEGPDGPKNLVNAFKLIEKLLVDLSSPSTKNRSLQGRDESSKDSAITHHHHQHSGSEMLVYSVLGKQISNSSESTKVGLKHYNGSNERQTSGEVSPRITLHSKVPSLEDLSLVSVPPFDYKKIRFLPKVAIVDVGPLFDIKILLSALNDPDIKGIIVQAMGDGTLSINVKDCLSTYKKTTDLKPMIRCSYVPIQISTAEEEGVVNACPDDNEYRCVPAKKLTANKAAIVLSKVIQKYHEQLLTLETLQFWVDYHCF